LTGLDPVIVGAWFVKAREREETTHS
jgi:hypothetical protein